MRRVHVIKYRVYVLLKQIEFCAERERKRERERRRRWNKILINKSIVYRKLPRFHPRVNKTEIIYSNFNEREPTCRSGRSLIIYYYYYHHSMEGHSPSAIISASLIVHCNSSFIRNCNVAERRSIQRKIRLTIPPAKYIVTRRNKSTELATRAVGGKGRRRAQILSVRSWKAPLLIYSDGVWPL